MTRSMRRCTKCVLPESAPSMEFDENGVCNHCQTYKKIKYQGEAALLDILDKFRGTGNKYDCIVGLSGGRDSSYTMLKLVKDYDMRVLAVNYLNPFTHPQATANMKHAVEVLGVDFLQFKDERGLPQKMFVNNLRAWFRKPSPAMIPMICAWCKPLNAGSLKIAKQNNIHLIVYGGNRFEDVDFKKELLGLSKDERQEVMLMKAIIGMLKGLAKNPAYFKPQFVPTMVKGYLFGDPYALGSRFVGRNITWLDLFFYIEWNEREILSRITSELGWDYPREDSSWRFDCKIGKWKKMMTLKTVGLTERDDFYSKMIREGVMTRDEALQRLHKENKVNMGELVQMLDELGVQDVSFLS